MSSSSTEFACCVELAKSSRARCFQCSRTIAEGKERIGRQYDPNHSGYRYYHPRCFPARYRPADTVDPADFYFGWEKLSPKSQATILNELKGGSKKPAMAVKRAALAFPPSKVAELEVKAKSVPQNIFVEAPTQSFTQHFSFDFFERTLDMSHFNSHQKNLLTQKLEFGDPFVTAAYEVALFDQDVNEFLDTLSLLL